LETLRLRLDEAGAEVQRGPLPEVTGDATLLTQLFQNLIGNALKFRSEQRPVIELTVEKHSHGWTLGVRDNGIGITPEHAEQVFLPFQRLHAMGEYEGSGIGLAICRKSVERHGGRIWVESEAGKGAHFMFTIPGTDDEQEKS
jgi:light-regulated signal transduction histidine kinase (bacteriophytochrome)